MIAVVGGGPAGLRAAEVAAQVSAEVVLFEGKASVGRKFLVAGKGGLNLTHEEEATAFAIRYVGPETPATLWEEMLADFSAQDVRRWSAELGCETFVATSGRVYPQGLKAAGLLRSWVSRLRALGVRFQVRHRLCELRAGPPWELKFESAGGRVVTSADAVVLALGGGSWPETGSNGGWTGMLACLGISVAPLLPANCGWEVGWSAELRARAEGLPLKNIVARVGSAAVEGELLLTEYGLEGGALYQLGHLLRQQTEPLLEVDLKPSFSAEQLVAKLGGAKDRCWQVAQQRWRLSPAAVALLEEVGAARLSEASALAHLVKHCQLRLQRPRPIAEAISSAGGVRWKELTGELMLTRYPGLFVAGEMIDWEAPTGGYLLQGAFSTGTRAGAAAARFSRSLQTLP